MKVPISFRQSPMRNSIHRHSLHSHGYSANGVTQDSQTTLIQSQTRPATQDGSATEYALDSNSLSTPQSSEDLGSPLTRCVPSSASDIESSSSQCSTLEGTEQEEKIDPYKDMWDSPTDPRNPRNWPSWLKWSNIGLISAMMVITQLASSLCAPALSLIVKDLHVTSETTATFILSIHQLGFALGPLIIAPLSEVYGRAPAYNVCNILFVLSNLGCALAPNVEVLMLFRFLSGAAGSCALVNVAGSIADIVQQKDRGKVGIIFCLPEVLEPVIGPVAGGFLAAEKGWRWTFWIVVILSGVNTMLCLAFLRESFVPVILARRYRSHNSSNDKLSCATLAGGPERKRAILLRSFLRPLRLLVLSPLVLALTVYMALLNSYTILLFSNFGSIFAYIYHWPVQLIGLSFLGVALGSTSALVLFGLTSDKQSYSKNAAGENVEAKPETRLPWALYGTVLLLPGLLGYGWSVQTHIHWIAPILFTALFGAGLVLGIMGIFTYLIDCYAQYAASAIAANMLFRSVIGGTLPLAGTALYSNLGMGWGCTVLAGAVLVGTPGVWALCKYGERLRARFEIRDI